jgi:hypothetical protein
VSELIPGTALPVQAPGSSPQVEGRGTVGMGAPKSLLQKISEHDQITPSELAYADHALRAFANQPKKQRFYWVTAQASTDATTGNVVIPVFQVPAGFQAGIANVVADAPDQTAITPSAPFANAASWSFVAKQRETSITNPAQAVGSGLRRGLVAFAPVTAAGPILPGQWTFGSHNSPLAFGGETIYYVLVGGSQASLTNIVIQVQMRLNLVAAD